MGAVVDSIGALESLELVALRRSPARPAQFSDWPDWVDARVRERFASKGIARPWSHQARAVELLGQGRDLVLATATASGKSLCYQAPVMQAVLEDPRSRALFLFPTKALARDQVEAMRALVGEAVGVGTYDGDTPPDQRRAARARAHVIATNPDMLHRGLLPHHDRWAPVLAGLRYVVIDELHTYRGVFGSHVANVLRRLWRACSFHGSRPQIIACSATIANPVELASTLCARSNFALVDESTAPAGARTFAVFNPAVVDPLIGVRRDYLKASRAALAELRAAEVTTLAFCRTRKAVELLTRYLREDEAGVREGGRSPMAESTASPGGLVGSASVPRAARGVGPWARMQDKPKPGSKGSKGGRPRFQREAELSGPVDAGAMARARRKIRGYRGGYLPEHRREIEDALRRGEVEVVTATNALELGMDIGGLDAVVLAGYPGTRAATWQRSGRAGRRQAPALTVMILSSRPLDQFIAADPEFLFAEPPEHARVDPLNPEILVPHLRCAAYELPFGFPLDEAVADRSGEGEGAEDPSWWRSWGDLPELDLASALTYLSDHGALLREVDEAGCPRFYAIGSAFPADGVDLRGSIEENFAVIEERPGTAEHGRILAEVDFEDGPLYLHPGAIYPLEGAIYEVRRLDWDERKAYVREATVSYYTEAICKLKVRMLEGSKAPPVHERALSEVVSGTGYAHVVRAVPGFKKLRFRTHENIGFGPVRLPDLELHTVAAYWSMPDALMAELADPYRRANAALAAAHAIQHIAAMVLMCEPSDLRHAVTSGPPGPEGVAAWAPVGKGQPSAEARLAASGRPTIYLYDDLPGGAGLATRVHAMGRAFFERVLGAVRGCRCGTGCPTCIGTEVSLDTAELGSVRGAPLPDPRMAGVGDELRARQHARADTLATLEALCEGVGA
ncbi:DEAD/DEAH box helicase-like protein [Plesiocystis pacifica SIR-1]|uniref:DEAD/DEAH box helicase-like protein n=1 Tax=Plesiocystis pacifica SIR-1 TaxID=391625 RepID=A6GIY3_9BACT|nr:DEAD/DEAH box helicase [Plesiocystis pacifica]EDM74180.1 DEAD/DEAH box helicase-like protein [Plesiocystis pacifica SIR-1]